MTNTSSIAARQEPSKGLSGRDIQLAALDAASARPALDWLDIGCGTGEILRSIRDDHAPRSLRGTDVINWLADDLAADVEVVTGPAELTLPGLADADRVLMIEVMEHLESPWTVLRAATRLVRSGGRLVVTTPHVANLRHRLELVVRGQLTSFRPDNHPHLTPVLPHVVRAILVEEGLSVSTRYAGIDLIPLTGGQRWPAVVRNRLPGLTHRSVVITGTRNAVGGR